MSTHWGQLVCGPPGSGKTTYCAAMHEFLNKAGRPTVIVNLDPANERTPYPCAVNLLELIRVEDVAELYGLGPNGGLMYCLEFLEANLDWLEEKLVALKGHYFIFDCPGQAELYTHHTSFAKIMQHLQKKLDFRLASVHLVDAHYCSDGSKYISAALLSLTAMIRLELSHVNVLSKLDLVAAYGQPLFGLDFYTECHDLQRLVTTINDGSALGGARERLRKQGKGKRKANSHEEEEEENTEERSGDEEDEIDDDEDDHGDDGNKKEAVAASAPASCAGPTTSSSIGGSSANAEFIRKATEARRRIFLSKHRQLNSRLAEVVEDYSLLSYLPISVKEPESLLRLIKVIDKSHGFVPIHSSSSNSNNKASATLPLSAGLAPSPDGSVPAWMPRDPLGSGASKKRGKAGSAATTSALSLDGTLTAAGGAGGAATSSGDAIADTPLSEWDFERLSGFEERYLNRFGREIYPDQDDDDDGGSSDGDGDGREGRKGKTGKKRGPLKSNKVKEQQQEAKGAESAAATAFSSSSSFAQGTRSGPKPGEKRPAAVVATMQKHSKQQEEDDEEERGDEDEGERGYGADAEAMDEIPGLEPARD